MTRLAPLTPEHNDTDSRRSTLRVLGFAAAIGSTGLAAGGTAGALLATHLAGNSAVAGLPLGLLVLGSAAAALLISRASRRGGRARSLSVGYLAGASGAALVVVAASVDSFPALLVGSLLLGSANAALFLSRYAAAEVADGNGQGRALALVLFSTSVGAVTSPLLLGPTGRLAQAAGLPGLTGLFLTAALSFGVAAVILARAARAPAARSGAALSRATRTDRQPTWRQIAEGLRARPAMLGLGALMAGNFVMVAVMTVAPVHLVEHGHGLESVGIAISLHVAGMFAPSPVAGWASDRIGPAKVAAFGCLLVLLAALVGAGLDYAASTEVVFHLVALGIGWNFTIVGGSMLIAHSVPDRVRVDVEGIGEVAMGVAAAVAAPVAGAVNALGGFGTLSLVGAAVAAGALTVGARLTGNRPEEHVANGCSIDEDAQGA